MPVFADAQPSAVLLTSGSTGTPQAHGKAWGTLVRNVDAAARRLAERLGRATLEGLTLVGTVPAQHSYGFESTVLLAMLGGAAFDASRPFFPADIAAALESVPRPRALVTTPVHLRALLRSELALPPVDLVLSATAPLSPQLAQECERRTGGILVEIYGCTEAGQVASRRTALGEPWHTFGELEVRAVAPTPALPEGGFVVQGGHVDVETPLADILELDDARRFRLLGRVNDLIHVAGKRSSLGHLNYHLNSVPGIDDGAFWMPPDVADRVVRPIAFVVAPALSDAQVLDGLRGRIEPQFLPRRIVRLDALPREATGKLTERTLRELAAAHGEGVSP
jgi:acyl-coenzyme A synthetase/AMP-(fatty) acid ligase